MQINLKNKSIYLWVIVIVLLIVAIVLLTSKKSVVTQSSGCDKATPIAQEAALAWGNTEDISSKAYQTKLALYLTDTMKQSFEQEWQTLDPQVKYFSKLQIKGVTCTSDANQVTVKIDGLKSDSYENLKPVEITAELINSSGKYLVNGFADNYQGNLKKIY